jgi:hypothetical protein
VAVRGAVAARGYAFWGGGWLAVAGAGLRLEIREFTDLTRWRWVLADDGGTFLSGHEVRLDPKSWQFEAFRDLQDYLSWHVAPDRRSIDEARIVSEVGEWIAAQVLGPVAGELVRRARRRHVTVQVIVPDAASELLVAPLELAYVGGKPLAVQDVTLVMQTGSAEADEPDAEEPANRERLRVLGLFSLPEGGQPLNLRRERQTLVTLVRGIAAAGKAADVRVLQYGVTRDLLRDVLAEAEGWDLIHISGHGAPGELLLETADGKPDRVSAATLADLLMVAREHVQLITVAACWSAARTVAEQRHLLGLPVRDDRGDGSAERAAVDGGGAGAGGVAYGTLATELSRRLGCAVLAMRYPVDDDFAIALTGTLYDRLLAKGQPLPNAVGMTLRELSSPPSEAPGQAAPEAPANGQSFPALSVATPALFGGTAVGLSLAAPERVGPADYDTVRLKLPGFPPQPERFVGRTAVMARSSATLALRSGIPGVLLHGMPGGGKTACALELAYGHEDAFDRLVWYKAPDEDMAIDGALTDLAFILEQELPGFQMLDVLVSDAQLTAFLPRLTELVEQRRTLIVIDNAESLISEGGEWRDGRWGQVIGALTAHRGLGRLILTSRRVPVGLTGLRVEAVDALSADEALLLARELPHLKALIYDELPGLDPEDSRRLALGVLNVAQGHPKLLELANGQAAHPDQLAKLVEAGDQAWREQGGLPDGFFATGETTASASAPASPAGQPGAPASETDSPPDGKAATAADYWHVLGAWTRSVADTLAPGERDLFWFVCCPGPADRGRGADRR